MGPSTNIKVANGWRGPQDVRTNVDWLILDTRTFYHSMGWHPALPARKPSTSGLGCRKLACISPDCDYYRWLRIQLDDVEGATKAEGQTFVGWICPTMEELTCTSCWLTITTINCWLFHPFWVCWCNLMGVDSVARKSVAWWRKEKADVRDDPMVEQQWFQQAQASWFCRRAHWARCCTFHLSPGCNCVVLFWFAFVLKRCLVLLFVFLFIAPGFFAWLSPLLFVFLFIAPGFFAWLSPGANRASSCLSQTMVWPSEPRARTVWAQKKKTLSARFSVCDPTRPGLQLASDQWKWCDPLENFVLQSLAKFVYCCCDMLWQQLWWLFDLMNLVLWCNM